jgi:hypothetical protein
MLATIRLGIAAGFLLQWSGWPATAMVACGGGEMT